MSKILYPNSEGGVSVVHPTGELSIEDVAQKDVPAGTPYLIVEDDVIPTDRSFRCLLYTSPSPRDVEESRMPSSA